MRRERHLTDAQRQKCEKEQLREAYRTEVGGCLCSLHERVDEASGWTRPVEVFSEDHASFVVRELGALEGQLPGKARRPSLGRKGKALKPA